MSWLLHLSGRECVCPAWALSGSCQVHETAASSVPLRMVPPAFSERNQVRGTAAACHAGVCVSRPASLEVTRCMKLRQQAVALRMVSPGSVRKDPGAQNCCSRPRGSVWGTRCAECCSRPTGVCVPFLYRDSLSIQYCLLN